MTAAQPPRDDRPPIVRVVAASFDCLQEEAHREGVDFGEALLGWFMWAIQAAIDAGVSRDRVFEAMETGRIAYIERNSPPKNFN